MSTPLCYDACMNVNFHTSSGQGAGVSLVVGVGLFSLILSTPSDFTTVLSRATRKDKLLEA
jgi:hypothetical protein